MSITMDKDGTEQNNIIDDNVIQPFRLESSNIRGRMIRMGDPLKTIIEQHNYPLPVSYLLSEALTLSLLLASMLKYDGLFTLQIQANGPIKTIVTDVNANGHVRAYAGFDNDAFKDNKLFSDTQNYFHLLDKGHMAFTVDQGKHMERYQGIVALEGKSLLDSVQHYFNQSEQIQTCIRMAIHPQDDQWRAGAVMVQYIPDNTQKPADFEQQEELQENWNRTCIMQESCQDDELLSPNLHSADVLYRLFHEEGVRIYPATPIKHVCRCSKERVENALNSLSNQDLGDSANKDGNIDMTCEFCGKTYIFTKNDIQQLKE